eukprot:92093_1
MRHEIDLDICSTGPEMDRFWKYIKAEYWMLHWNPHGILHHKTIRNILFEAWHDSPEITRHIIWDKDRTDACVTNTIDLAQYITANTMDHAKTVSTTEATKIRHKTTECRIVYAAKHEIKLHRILYSIRRIKYDEDR